MKIELTFQKADIISLVLKELQRKGLRPVDPTNVVYKGALEVRLFLDVDNFLAEDKIETYPDKPIEDLKLGPLVEEEDAELSMDEILHAAKGLDTKPPKTIVLGPNESLEYPGRK